MSTVIGLKERKDIEQINEPDILGKSTYFWNSCGSASKRNWREGLFANQVSDYFKKIGMKVEIDGCNVYGSYNDTYAHFYYYESCKNVYKGLNVTVGGKKSNISALRKLRGNFYSQDIDSERKEHIAILQKIAEEMTRSKGKGIIGIEEIGIENSYVTFNFDVFCSRIRYKAFSYKNDRELKKIGKDFIELIDNFHPDLIKSISSYVRFILNDGRYLKVSKDVKFKGFYK